MAVDYNRMAGTNVGRLAALSDGIFAVAMTLLVLELKTPARELIHTNADLRSAMAGLAPEFITYFVSVLTLGIFWIGQQAQLNALARGDRNFTWINLVFLAAVSLIPFSTRLLADFFTYRAAIFIYWLNLLALGGFLYAAWAYAAHADLLSPETGVEVRRAIKRRIVVAQAIYGLGALLCLVDNRLSLGVIFLTQLNYMLGFRKPLLPSF